MTFAAFFRRCSFLLGGILWAVITDILYSFTGYSIWFWTFLLNIGSIYYESLLCQSIQAHTYILRLSFSCLIIVFICIILCEIASFIFQFVKVRRKKHEIRFGQRAIFLYK
ncbi:DNA translocase FtsK 4TM domain-containing protein [uncultured Varibaculum sp.]|uniref:DNA translocase FtsK 4TM domain-containing protein n=1 Tax=uncultured Varibaculum sp. TaxID=413896 RepID=UPI0035A58327